MNKNNMFGKWWFYAIIVGIILIIGTGLFFILKPVDYSVDGWDGDQCQDRCFNNQLLWGCFEDSTTCRCFVNDCEINICNNTRLECISNSSEVISRFQIEPLFNVRFTDLPTSAKLGDKVTINVWVTNLGKEGTKNIDVGIYQKTFINEFTGKDLFSAFDYKVINKNNCIIDEPNVQRKEVSLKSGESLVIPFDIIVPLTQQDYGLITGTFDNCGDEYQTLDYREMKTEVGFVTIKAYTTSSLQYWPYMVLVIIVLGGLYIIGRKKR